MKPRRSLFLFISFVLLQFNLSAQSKVSVDKLKATMLEATQYMVDSVSTNGGYVWYYMPDFSRQWGEMEAYKTMIWLQHPGTVSMGHLFLDAYEATNNEYYYDAAAKAAAATIWGQSNEGGWNYIVDFAGDRSLKEWYSTIGKNGWRLEEFQHYYGNSTFDDDVTSDAARFLLRMYVRKFDPAYKPALEKAINFILKSQYPSGGWPQRYPLKYDFSKKGKPDYTSFYTFNDDVIWENIHFLVQCYLVLGEQRFLDPIYRGMNFYMISQDASGAWGQQLDMQMRTVGARTYEPDAFLPKTTAENTRLLMKFYRFTGDKRFLDGVPKAIQWLKDTDLPKGKPGDYTHPTFVELGTNRPLYVHRKGSNVKYGSYYVDYNDEKLLTHYSGKTRIDIAALEEEFNELAKMSLEEATKTSPLKVGKFREDGMPQSYHNLNRTAYSPETNSSGAAKVIQELDEKKRWLTTRAYVSNPYIGDGVKQEQTDKYATTRVGDETDTSPYLNETDQQYISTSEYIKNMQYLITYLSEMEK